MYFRDSYTITGFRQDLKRYIDAVTLINGPSMQTQDKLTNDP